MSAIDLLEDSFPHGALDGHLQGCKTAHCPAPISCTDMKRRYDSDWSFRKRVDGGWTAAELAVQDIADAVAARDTEKAARRAEKAAERGERAPRLTAAKPKLARPVSDHPRGGIPSKPWTAAELAELRELNKAGKSDAQIGEAIDRSPRSVWAKRDELGIEAIPQNVFRHGSLTGYNRGCRDECPESPSCRQVMSAHKRERRARKAAA